MRIQYTGIACDRTMALMSGRVQPEGVDFEYVVGHPADIFRRMFSGEGPEASELSCSNYVIERSRGDERFMALPVFPSRVFRHNTVFVNVHAGIERPEDLRGKRVGLPEYNQTANFWVRAFLQHDYGVLPESIHWVRAEAEKIATLRPPPNVQITEAPHGRSLSDLLDAGEIDALISLARPQCFLDGSPNVRRLFPDFARVEAEYFRRTGHFPIMHVSVLRRDVYEADRSLARKLYDAFCQAKEYSYRLTRDTGALVTNLPLQIAHAEETKELFGDDPFPYGAASNRHTVDALAQYVYEQGFATRVMRMEELFAPELMDT